MTASAPLLRGAAWPAIVGLTVCAAVVGGGVRSIGTASSSLLTIAVALLTAAGGFALDEPAAAIADVAPISPRHVLAVRSAAMALPCLVGCGIAVLAAHDGDPSILDYAIALSVAPLLGFTLAHLARRRMDEPGALIAVAIVLIVLVTSMTAFVGARLRLVPTTNPATGNPADTIWLIILAACLSTLLATSRP